MATTALSSSTSTALSTSAAATAAANKANAQKLLTSLGAGSGVDVSSLAQNLVSAERVPKENAINAKITKNESRISGYSALSFVLSGVKTAMTALKDQNNFNAVTATNSNTAAFSVTTSAAATTGTHDIEVLRLAKAQRSVSSSLSSGTASLNGGSAMSLSLTVGDASKVTPTVSTTQGVSAVTETSTVSFQSLLAGQKVSVAGLTYTATQDTSAADVAAAFSGLTEIGGIPTSQPANGILSGALAGFNAGVSSGSDLVFTSTATGQNVNDLAVTTSLTATTPSVTTTQGVSAVTEHAAVTFKDMAAGQSVTVAGLTYTTTASATAAEVASVFASRAASGTTPTNPSTGTFSGALTGFNAGGNLGTGTLNFSSTTPGANVADIATSGASARISLAAGKDTPQDIVNAINASTTGVKAQLVNTGDGSVNPYQIILSGAVGASGAFTISTNYGSGSGSPGLSFGSNAANQTAVDASVKIDGVSYTRSTNSVTDVVPGLTLNLKATTTSAASVDLTRDTSTIKENIKAIVTAYNDAVTIFGEVSDPKSTFETYGATLVGDSTVRTVKQQLRSMVMGTSSTPGDSVGSLWQMGVSIDQTGVMSVDDTKLDAALADHYTDVVKAFTGNQNGLTIYSPANAGIAGDAVKKLTNMLGKTGILVTQSESADTQNTKYKAELTKLQTRMDALLLRYQKQFSSMDSLVGNVNSQKTSLKSTFEGMMASLTGKSG
jgi:flagellar hook-associated protein 2